MSSTMEWIGARSPEQFTFTPSSTPNSSLEPAKMRVGYFSNEFPHDDLKDLLRHLHVHSRDIQYPTLARFIHQATLAIHEEVRLLPATLRMLVPPFETVFNLADDSALRNGPLGGAVDGMLLCAVQLATLIGYYENGLDEDFYHSSSVDTCLAGLGTGLLSTAAVSLSSTLADMPLAGAEVVRLAFRLGVLVDEVSQNLQSRQTSEAGPGDSWAYVVPDVTADEVQRELDAIHTTEKIHEASKVFLSALSQTSVTVSGPPARLKHIFHNSEFFRDRRSIALPVYAGLCHAKHVYNEEHVNSIIQTSSLELLDAKFAPRVPILSTSTGRPFLAKSAKELFHNIIEEILTQAIQWDHVIQFIVQRAIDMSASECQILVFRTSLPIHDLVTALNSDVDQCKTTTKDLIPWITRPDPRSSKANGTASSKIAIVGMSCRMPGGATDTEKFWQLLESGLDVHRKIPADRFDVDSHYDPTGKRVNTSHTSYGCFIDEPGLFDAPFFNMSPREAEQTDPMQRLAIVTAYEALERAGYVANRTAATRLERIGTFYGQASDDYREVNTAQEVSTYFIPGGCRAFGPGRINYFFKFAGPSYSIDSACSSSLATIQSACTALWNGELDTAVVGGMNVLTNSDAFAGLSHGHFLTKTPNACKTWDSEADGYCRADAVASLVMKRLEDAEADNDNILGVILAAGTNHSANAISITHPHAGHQAYLGRLVLNRAGVDPLDVGFVEMHGTGTQAGDAEEIQSVSEVFSPQTGGKRRSAKNPLYIGAVKANVGHSEAAAGVTAVIKVLLMLQNNAIAPHVGIKNSLNPLFPKFIDGRHVQIPYQKVEWPRLPSGRKRIAMVNNFSAAGGNTSLALEEAPLHDDVEAEDADPRPAHVIAVSAKSKVSLRGNLERLLGFLDANGESLSSLEHLSYTTTARRHHHNHRVAFAASDVTQVKKHLHSALGNVDLHKPISSSTGPPPVAFVFTGQGASYKSYNLELFHHCPSFRTQVLHLDKLARSLGFPSFLPVLDGSHAQDHLHSAVMSQLALVCMEMALFKYWASLGVRPDVVVGHSLGEYAALNAAGVLSASDAIFLVGQRARLLEQRCQVGSHKMVAVRASVEQIETSLMASGAPYEVACMNDPNGTVLSGPASDMETTITLLENHGHKCFTLDVPFAFHSAQTDPVLDEFETLAASGVLFQPPQLPIISPLLDKVIFDEKTVNAKYVRRATRESVNFLGALQTAHRIGTVDDDTVWIEIGPHPVCVNFVKNSLDKSAFRTAIPSFRRGENNWKTLADSLAALHCAGVKIEWNEFHSPFEKGLRLLDIPTYAWNNKNYWIQYNGDWALTKGNHFYDEEKGIGAFAKPLPTAGSVSSLSTTTVQSVLEESFGDAAGTVLIQSDLSQRDFRAAAWGHKMNNCGVVTSSIHADLAFTLGNYLYKKLRPKSTPREINITNLEVLKGLVANSKPDTPQLFQVRASTEDIDSNIATLTWYNVHDGLPAEEPFATATLFYETATVWLSSWNPMTHLVQSRIQDLQRLADSELANRFSNSMAYKLFASNLVDYAAVYRGMQSVVLYGLEAFAEVTLASDGGHGGNYTVPPHFIDSVAHLAGFVMNVSDALDTESKYAVTPGWRSLRFAKPLVPGGKYTSYVKMIPTEDDPSVFFGDVYVLQDGQIMGMCEGIQFRRYPRILLSRFFSAPDDSNAPPVAHATKAAAPKKVAPAAAVPTPAAKPQAAPAVAVVAVPPPSTPVVNVASSLDTAVAVAAATIANPDSTSAKAIQLVASEAALDLADLIDGASFAELGVDSLMSLVIAEKFREQLGVVVNGSLFLEYPTIGDLRSWLDEYYT